MTYQHYGGLTTTPSVLVGHLSFKSNDTKSDKKDGSYAA